MDATQSAAARRSEVPGDARLGLDGLTAVILNWNQPDLTIQSAKSLIGDGLPPCRIVAVDNGSSDGSWARLQEMLPDCNLVGIDKNLGFARGNNVGASVLPGSSYLFVNSDAFVHRRGSVSELVRALAAPRVGVVVPRLLNGDLTLQPSVVPTLNPGSALVRTSGLSRFVPNRLQPQWSVYWDHGGSREIQAAIGAVLLVHAALWDEFGGFRENSFMYAEDLDLCWRARELGWRVWFAADSEFLHEGGGSTSWDASGRAERAGHAEAAMIREHLSPAGASLTLGILRSGFAARFAYRKLTRDDAAAAECAGYVRGYGARTAHEKGEHPAARPEIVVIRPDATTEHVIADESVD